MSYFYFKFIIFLDYFAIAGINPQSLKRSLAKAEKRERCRISWKIMLPLRKFL
jgi:hypothetical protein